MLRAIFTDVDGTLLNGDRQLSSRTIRAIRSVAASVTVVLASSRMPAAMRHLQTELGIEEHPLLCYNGGYVLSSGRAKQVYASHVIPLDICRGIVANTDHTRIHISLYHADNWYARQLDRWTEKEQRVTKVAPQIRSFDDVLSLWAQTDAGAHKIMCMGDESDIADLYAWLDITYGHHIHVYRSRPTYLELATREVSKATGMSLIMRHLHGDDGDVLAFGDNYNDVEMLRQAGIGVAVANAIQEAKDAADEITGAGREDGVAICIEKYFGLPAS